MQSDRVDKSAVGWDHRESVAKHESQVKQSDYKTVTGGAGADDSPGPVGTNYVKTKPDGKYYFYQLTHSCQLDIVKNILFETIDKAI